MFSEGLRLYGEEREVTRGKVSYRSILAGTYPPPPMAIMRLGLNSLRICSADAWQSLWT